MVQFYSKLFSSYEFLNFNCKALILMARVGTDCNLKKLGQGFQIKLLCCRLTMYCFPFDRIVWYLSFRVPMWTHVWEYLSGLTQKIWNSPWLTHLIEALQRRNIVQPFCNISFKVLNITNSLFTKLFEIPLKKVFENLWTCYYSRRHLSTLFYSGGKRF